MFNIEITALIVKKYSHEATKLLREILKDQQYNVIVFPEQKKKLENSKRPFFDVAFFPSVFETTVGY